MHLLCKKRLNNLPILVFRLFDFQARILTFSCQTVNLFELIGVISYYYFVTFNIAAH